MDKPLELLVTNDKEGGARRGTHSNGPSVVASSENAPKRYCTNLSYPVHALVINSLNLPLRELEAKLDECLNLSWHEVRSFNTYSSRSARPYNLILLVLPNDEAGAIQALQSAASYGVDTIILGQDSPPNVLRLAFQQGVSDFITLEQASEVLLPSIEKIAHKLAENADLAPVLAVVNGKGGSGASFIASSVAMIASVRGEGEVALLDTDLVQGTLAHMLGVEPRYFITEAIGELDSLDEVALKGAMTNKGHLHLLASEPFAVLNATESIDLRLANDLLLKCRQYYDQVIIDLSRGPETWNADMLTNADILLVMQQNVMSIRETKAVIHQLVNFMGIDPSHIHVLVNRYQKNSTEISIKDIKSTTGVDSILVVANDFKLASQCIDLGTPITQVAKREQMYTDLAKVVEKFFPNISGDQHKQKGFFSRLLGN
ncbi:AAA family ATPase [Shewanella atlantica]|uniref:Pilus assembly protein CpaE n=1 Tax=Shewanella atlantica TaxID=271099 RepID=A0A3S0K157_9GAMM|nr:pilus assembly protein CpaE [Shewanella atlantica]RTR33368.1 pilus assembly protein CpaE [Shewanella atlantica]